MTTYCARIALLLLAPTTASSAAAPILIVANQNSPVSKSIAEYYARRRGIPRSGVCPISAPERETITRAEYTALEAEVGKCLRSGDRVESTLYIVTTLGVPLRVSGSGGLGGDCASVDSELTLLYAKLHGAKINLSGVFPNPLYNRPSAVFRHPDIPIYLVTRLAAYDFAAVRALIDRSLRAKNTGKFVLDAKSGRTATGDDWLLDAAIALPSDRTVFDESPEVITGATNVIGYASWGSNDGRRTERRPGFGWLPGAVMTEYVSTNARTFERPPAGWRLGNWRDQSTWFAGSPQSLIADAIAEGVTGIAGHVYEPYLHMTPRPNLLLPAWYRVGIWRRRFISQFRG